MTVEPQEPYERGARARQRKPAKPPAAKRLDLTHRNEVLLVGRISSPLRTYDLPSGDVVGMLRVVVERGEQRSGGRTRNPFDAIDCASWSPRAHRKMEKWDVGDVIEVTGWLRRRFFRNALGRTSRYEIEVRESRLLASAAEVPPKARKGAGAKSRAA